MPWDERIGFWMALYLKLPLQKQLNRVRNRRCWKSYSFLGDRDYLDPRLPFGRVLEPKLLYFGASYEIAVRV